jgi:Flp pilus assembly protein TadD/4-amino-4-deoxy-L-arabinose transferase-like glycosyltransferase
MQKRSMRQRPSSSLMTHTWILPVLIVFTCALGLKLGYLHERLQMADLDHPTLDSLFHDQWAKGLAFGDWTPDQAKLRSEPYFRAPLYPYFMSIVYRCFGPRAAPLFAVQLVLGALTTTLMFMFCKLAFSTRVAFIAAFLQIFYWPFTYHEAERLLPALSLPLDMSFLLTLLLAGRSKRFSASVAAGLVAGLSAITRPSILIAVPFALFWLFRRTRSYRLVAALSLSLITVIAPVTLRNLVVGHDFVPIAWQDGPNFFIGNNPKSNGTTAIIPGTRADWWGGFDDMRRIAEESAGGTLKPSQISRYWYRQAEHFLVNEPGAAFRLYVRKVALLLGNAEPSNERQLYFQRRQSKILSLLCVNFAFILCTASVGLWSLRARPQTGSRSDSYLSTLLAIPYTIGIVAFFVTSRFRLPVALLLIPPSAAGITQVYTWIRGHDWRSAAVPIFVMVAIFSASMMNPYGIGHAADARGYYGDGTDRYREGDYRKAAESLTRSVNADPSFAPAWLMRGRAELRLGEMEQAVDDLRVATEKDSTLADGFFWLGVAYQRSGTHDLAEPAYRRSIALDPSRVEAFTNLADVYFRQGRREDAVVELRKALSVDSTYVNARYALGYYYETIGEMNKALAEYKRALPFPPAQLGIKRIERRHSSPN